MKLSTAMSLPVAFLPGIERRLGSSALPHSARLLRMRRRTVRRQHHWVYFLVVNLDHYNASARRD
jgi:hypothetical protein